MQAKINPSFWSDDSILECDTGMKLATLWALTNPRVDCLGMTRVSQKMFEFETQAPYDLLTRTSQALPRFMSIHGNILWVHNYVRYQLGSGRKLIANNCFVSLLAKLESLSDKELQRSFIGAYPEFTEAFYKDPQKGGYGRRGLLLPSKVEGEGEGEGVLLGKSAERGEIPDEKEWLEACAMAGLPADFAKAEWHKLGESGFQVRNGCYLTRANLHHAIARRVGWWREQRNSPRLSGPRLDRVALQAELENLRSAADPSNLDRRKEIVRMLGGGEA